MPNLEDSQSNVTGVVADLTKGQAFLADDRAVEVYRAKHGSMALMAVVFEGSRFLVRHSDKEFVKLISYSDFSERVVARDVFDKDHFSIILDEMPLYLNPSPESLEGFNKEVEAYTRAASLCVSS